MKRLIGIVALTLLTSAFGCKCIEQPLTHSEQTKKAIVDVSAKLEKLPAQGDVKTNFEQSVKTDFATLNDDNTALLLYLNAIDCYLRHGKIGGEVAKELVEIVRKWWGAKHGFSPGGPLPGALQPVEKSTIKQSPENAAKIFARFRQFGIDPGQ